MNETLTPELCELFAAVHRNGDAAEVEATVAELQAMLKADPELRHQYAQYVVMCSCLQLECAAPQSMIAAGLKLEAPQPVQSTGDSLAFLRIPIVRYAIAAAVVLAVGLGITALVALGEKRINEMNAPSVAIATLIESRDAVFEDSDVPTDVGSQLPNGFLRMKSGTATIRFHSGATVTVEGPVEFGLNSEMRGFLSSGKLLAHVPPQAHGFTIGAMGVSVIDLGTEFGMVAGKGGTQVHVLTGRVDLKTEGGSRQLHVGDACAVAETGAIREIHVQPELFAREVWRAPVDGSLVPHAVARQSSSYTVQKATYVAQNATDGDPNTFTHTDAEDAHPWFQLDLERESFITRVAVHNRLDCCGGRLRDITVEVLDGAGKVVFASPMMNPHNAWGAGAGYAQHDEHEVALLAVNPGVTGTAIRIRRTPDPKAVLDDRNVLSLGEVEVIGHVLSPVRVEGTE